MRSFVQHSILVGLLYFLLLDLVARIFGGHEATISAIVADFCERNLVMAVAIGVVIGHIFWPNHS